MLEKANEYLGTDYPYRQIVKHEGMSIVYDDSAVKGEWRPVALSPSTVWRWLSWLGKMPHPQAGTRLWAVMWSSREQDRNAALHGQLWGVPSGKYRSQQRRETLQRARQLLAADRVWAKLYGKGIFPRYGISGGWT